MASEGYVAFTRSTRLAQLQCATIACACNTTFKKQKIAKFTTRYGDHTAATALDKASRPGPHSHIVRAPLTRCAANTAQQHEHLRAHRNMPPLQQWPSTQWQSVTNDGEMSILGLSPSFSRSVSAEVTQQLRVDMPVKLSDRWSSPPAPQQWPTEPVKMGDELPVNVET